MRTVAIPITLPIIVVARKDVTACAHWSLIRWLCNWRAGCLSGAIAICDAAILLPIKRCCCAR
jgi:hypothetical protein